MTWIASNIDVYGVRVAIRTNEQTALDLLPGYLPVGWKPLAGSHVERVYSLEASACEGGPVYVLREGERTLKTAHDLEQALQMLAYDLELHVVETTPEYVFVHAGVVGWRRRALLIPGRSFSGKSTLVASLCNAGATYYSDEYALLDDAGRAHAYPRPLRLRRQVVDADEPGAEKFGPAVHRPPLPIGMVVLTHYVPGSSWQPRRIFGGQALLEVLSSTLPARVQPQKVLAVLRKAVGMACVVQGPRGEVGEIRQSLLNGPHWHDGPPQLSQFEKAGDVRFSESLLQDLGEP